MRREYRYFVYIITNKYNKVLYTGVTNNLLRRVDEHSGRNDKTSFTAKYNIDKVVYYEVYEDIYAAIAREKQIKAGSRQKKINLVVEMNLEWKDLIEDFFN